VKSIRDLKRDERGQLLIIVILTLLVVSLVITPLLAFGYGSHRNASIREDRMEKVFAADAGIEAAYHKLKYGNGTQAGNYTIPDINGYSVKYSILKIAGKKGDYEVTSTASSNLKGDVTVVTHTETVDYKGMFDNVLTSQGLITIMPGSQVYGNISANVDPDIKGTVTCCNGTKSGMQCVDHNVPIWPTKEELGWPPRVTGVPGQDHYWTAAVAANTCASSIPVIGVTTTLGPCHSNGALNIYGKKQNPGTLTLTGTVYVEGTLTICSNNAEDMDLYLNGYTMYAEGDLTFGQSLTLHGPGCVVGIGSVWFSPNVIGNDGYIFVMSVSKDLQAQPGGDFRGSMAGITSVDLQPGNTLKWVDYPKDANGDPLLDFPGGTSYGLRIKDYIIVD